MTDSDTVPDAKALLALANIERMRILTLIAERPLSAAEIATESGTSIEGVTAHLTLFGQAGLIATIKDGHERRVRLRSDRLAEIEAWCRKRLAATAPDAVLSDAIPAGIRQFFGNGRLLGVPAKQSRYREVLAVLAHDFAPETDYPEAEVNAILLRRHDDFATLRRDLVDFGFMTRARGVYRRNASD